MILLPYRVISLTESPSKAHFEFKCNYLFSLKHIFYSNILIISQYLKEFFGTHGDVEPSIIMDFVLTTAILGLSNICFCGCV